MACPPYENWIKGLTLQISLVEKNSMNSPQDPASESDSEVIINVPIQSPETFYAEATFHTLLKDHPSGLKVQLRVLPNLLKEENSPLSCLLERTCSLFSIFHPDHLIKERYQTLQERRNSLQNDSLDHASYIVDLHFRSLANSDKNPKSHLSGEVLQEGNAHQ